MKKTVKFLEGPRDPKHPKDSWWVTKDFYAEQHRQQQRMSFSSLGMVSKLVLASHSPRKA